MFKRSVQKGFNAKRDWTLILIVTCLCLVGVVLYNVYVFRAIVDDTFISFSSEDVVVTTLPKESLSKAVELIKNKEKNRTAILNGEMDVVDPSL